VLLRTQPDEHLIAMARDGATAPFDEIVRRHRPALIAFAGTLAPPSRAEDVVQESLLKAFAALRDGAEPELLRAWLFRIVRNTAIDEQRGLRHHEQLDENYDGVEQPPQALARREQLAALMAAMADLPAAQRDAIVKRELEGRGHEEIGHALDLSPGAVRQLIYRARHTLREAAGTVIPVAVVRAASMPGADEAVGGLGMAGVLKLGLAAVFATGTIVAGTSIQRNDDGGTAEAIEISTPRDGSASEAQETAVDDRLGDDRRGDNGGSRDRSGRGESGERGPSGSGGPGPSEHSGSGDDGSGGNSGPGSDSSGPGSGGSDDGGASGEGPGDGGSGSSGSGSSGSGLNGSETSGEGVSGGGGPGPGDGGLVETSETSSSSGPG
jgi:RNA polymerase sigma factor (sigma-70 family)